ncbi:precorrin-6A reductase [Flammeovirga kamogawensis]|uniref:Precorrin-6A reductase n=1 Tax=Flammeovirga kamogawensis TaxID=373891 RepID=A0ABX8H2V0_9BACT|nr:precorrin-6A reductase [Flammeovirga kamogawensis]MBB6460342.1 precorrin-6x reductase [Flammeovirga kamogawensis]QWG10151.1 precorrin-6A reductase [Flammeovirga kamogawensis]TRX64603.1 precorrin-6A reductase [Flammeovirga kamogawensis]
MVLIFGGTTEGKKVIHFFERKKIAYIYSTKTKVEFTETPYSTYRYGALDPAQIAAFIIENNITTIINASHPFATELHDSLDKVCIHFNIPVIRLARKKLIIPKHPLIHYVRSYNKAKELLFGKFNGKKLLGLTGVQTIHIFEEWWKTNPAVFRILPRETSKEIANKAGFPKEQLILSMPSSDSNHEIALLKERNIEVVITKESGNSGFLMTKIDAALHCNIPILIVREPVIPSSFTTIYSVEELDKLMPKIWG